MSSYHMVHLIINNLMFMIMLLWLYTLALYLNAHPLLSNLQSIMNLVMLILFTSLN